MTKTQAPLQQKKTQGRTKNKKENLIIKKTNKDCKSRIFWWFLGKIKLKNGKRGFRGWFWWNFEKIWVGGRQYIAVVAASGDNDLLKTGFVESDSLKTS